MVRAGDEPRSDDPGRRVMIGVATYQRAQDLTRLLESLMPELDRCRTGAAPFVTDLYVIDNDPAGSARAVVEPFGAAVRYSVEPTPGIAAARNHTLRIFAGGAYESLIFVDDDEFVAPGWLSALVSYADSTPADVVSGPVVTLLPPDAPGWIVRGGFLRMPALPSGTRHWTAATNNTLLRYASWRSAGSPTFDESFSSTGGSDTEFFGRLTEAGKLIEFCDSAIVYEDAPSNRLTARWIRRRWTRMGIAHGRILRRRHGVPYLLAFGGVRIAAGAGGLAWGVLRGRGVQARPFQRFFYGVGVVASRFGVLVHEYGRR
ncbi:glycosyltransferase family 2 protein [Blastococcus sp. SYSU DS0753]